MRFLTDDDWGMLKAVFCVLVTLFIAMTVPDACRALDGQMERRILERDEHYELLIAERFVREKRFDDAIRVLERLCLNNPRFNLAAEHLVRCYFETGRTGRAIEFLEERLAKDPAHFPFARDLGNAYLDTAEREKALAVWNGVLERAPGDARNYGRIARLEVEAGFYQEAISTYRAGRVFEKLYQPYTVEIIRLERLLGRCEMAFREAIGLIAWAERMDMRNARLAAEIYAEAGFDERLLAVVDSVSAITRPVDARFLVARAALLIEAGKYGEAGIYVEERNALPAKQLYDFIRYLSDVKPQKRDPGFLTLYQEVLDTFLARYPGSPVAPGVMLALAENLREEAGGDGEKLADALRTAEEVVAHRWGKIYAEKVALFEARLLFEDLNRPREALEALGRVEFDGIGSARSAAEMRMQALVRVGDWEWAERDLEALAADPDSIISAVGRYGIGRMSFLRGDYEGAVASLSSFAESCPWSPWANDALEMAMLVAGALGEGRAPLDCYRAALSLEAEGRNGSAVDSLDAFAVRYAWSVLYPRVIYMRAGLNMRLGNVERAAGDFEALAERFPLDRLAPRALEQWAEIAAAGAKEDALNLYEKILQRYPDDPFLDRVRRRYVALRKSMEAGGNDD
jgi:tetratricopeptide (TPR) repeat protein